jgi:hypothetical protein
MSNYPMTRRHIQEKRMLHRHCSKKKTLKKLNKLFFAELVFVVELPSVAAASVSTLMDRMAKT